MTRATNRLTIGLLVIVCHAAAFFGILVWQSQYIPNGSDRLDLALLLIPISAVYVVGVVRSAVARRRDRSDDSIDSLEYTVISLAIAILFCSSLLFFVFSYPKFVGPTIVELRRWIIVLEIAFGASFGAIAEDLFGKIEKIRVDASGKPI